MIPTLRMNQSDSKTSLSLLKLAKSNDADAWCRLLELYSPLVYSWCRKSGLTPEDSADICQDVFRAVARSIPQFEKRKAGDRFRAWLRTVTQNKIRDQLRVSIGKVRASGGSEAYQQLMHFAEDDATSVSITIGGCVQETLDQVQSEFQENTWNAFWRTTIDGQPARNVAAELDMQLASVYQARSRVLRRLKRAISSAADGI